MNYSNKLIINYLSFASRFKPWKGVLIITPYRYEGAKRPKYRCGERWGPQYPGLGEVRYYPLADLFEAEAIFFPLPHTFVASLLDEGL